MKSIILQEIMPEDDCGYQMYRWAVINENQCYAVKLDLSWEGGPAMGSDSFTVNDDLYKFVFDKILDYLEHINGNWRDFKNRGCCGHYIYYCYAIHDSENNQKKLPAKNGKESNLVNFVQSYVHSHEERIDFDNLNKKYRDLFHYINLVTKESLFGFSDGYYEDVLEDISLEDLKKKIIEEWK